MNFEQNSHPLVAGALASIFAVPLIMSWLMTFSSMSIRTLHFLIFSVGVLITAPTAFIFAVPLALVLRRLGSLNSIYLPLRGTR